MISFDNLSFKACAFDNITLAANKKDSAYSINKGLLNVDMLSGYGRLNFGGNNISLDLGISTHLSIASNLVESLIVSTDTKIEVNSINALKSINAGYKYLLTANSGNGLADLESTSDVMKKKATNTEEVVFKIAAQSSAKTEANVASEGSSTSGGAYSPSQLNFVNALFNGSVHITTKSNVATIQRNFKNFKEGIATNDLKNAFAQLKLTNTLSYKDDGTTLSQENGKEMTISDFLSLSIVEETTIPAAFDFQVQLSSATSREEFDKRFKPAGTSKNNAGTETSQSSNKNVTEWKIKSNGIQLQDVTNAQYGKLNVVKMITDASGTSTVAADSSTIEEFFKDIFTDANGFNLRSDVTTDFVEMKKAFIIGEFFEKSTVEDTKTRIQTVSVIPSLDLTAAYGPVSFKGISFANLGLTVSSPVFDTVTEYVNSTFTFGINNVSIMPINSTILDGNGKVIAEELAKGLNSTLGAVTQTPKSKTIIESIESINKAVEPNKKLTSEYMSYLSNEKSSISDYITNNINVRVFAELQQPFMNISKGSIYINKSGSNWLFGLSIVSNKIKFDLI
jgi:hypothetical protein